jgi:XTP/dITP diphosphohydrolase
MDDNMDILNFITSNTHKFEEISRLFKEERLNYHLKQYDIETLEIQSESIREVALAKLNSVRDKLKTSYFVEDAGFFVDNPLHGFPGVYSSYVMKTIGNQGILRLISDFHESKAHFKTVIALYFKPHNDVYTFEGEVNGKVSKTIRGTGGFGFDPIFIPNEFPEKTFGELTQIEKNKISHRGRAWRKLIEFIKYA